MRRLCALSVLVMAGILAPAAAAAAASVSIVDATSDTWTTDYSPDGTVTDVSAGSQVNVDITKTVIKFANGKVAVKVVYAALDQSTNRYQLGLRLRTNEGLKRLAVVDTALSQDWSGVHALGKPNGDEVRCTGMTHAIDYDADTVRLVIPSTCLSKPRWVQAYVGADGYAMTTDTPTFSHDNGLDDSWTHKGWTAKIRKG